MHHKHLWLMTGILIAGVILGYSVWLYKTPSALSSALECPVECTGDNCPMGQKIPPPE